MQMRMVGQTGNNQHVTIKCVVVIVVLSMIFTLVSIKDKFNSESDETIEALVK
jgi:hypothetical protein